MDDEARLLQARAERDRFRAEAAALSGVPAELARAREELASLVASPGWRITAPLRSAKRLAIRVKRSSALRRG